jgi:UDP-sugar transporter A1/2/3
LFSVALLKKQLSRTQWFSMLLLFLGVAIVQSHETSESSVDPASQNRLIGFSAVLVSCLFSGFAGVYLEKILKSGHVSIWLRNIQLGLFASILAACGMAAKDGREIAEKVIFLTLAGIRSLSLKTLFREYSSVSTELHLQWS